MCNRKVPSLATFGGGTGSAASTTCTGLVDGLAQVRNATSALLLGLWRCGPGGIGQYMAWRRFSLCVNQVAPPRANWRAP